MKSSIVVGALLSMISISPVFALERGDTPWIGWGEGSYTDSSSSEESGFKFDGYFKQGYVVSNLGNGWFLVPYVAAGIKASEHSDEPWNNRAEPWLGIEARKPIDLGNGKWGDVSVGVRAGRYMYFDGGDNESIVSVYIGISAGGPNW
ncbi:MAG: hypothetical protein IPK84_00365 [Candidatus Moraniibacteriota bacterium]|nr:MAG: hypothetical protein IPK84_00365 [Candidatus Moranbacteria bacterium]